MYISEIYLFNFLSYKEQEYKFEIGKPLLIQGINKSNDSQESNGSGKSGLQSAIEYLLLKSTSRKGRDVDLIRRDQTEDAIVSCKVVCPVRKQTLSIKRIIPKKGSTTIEIKVNSVKQEIATVPDGNDFILKWLDITAEDLQNYYIINKERYVSFFDSSNTKKLSLISRFANIKLIDGVEDEVQGDVDEIDEVISEFENKLIALDSRKETFKEQLESESNRDLEKEKQEKIQALEEKLIAIDDKDISISEDIEKLEESIADNNGSLTDLKAKFDKLSKAIKKVKSVDFTPKINKLNESIESFDNDVSETDAIKRTFLNNIESIDRELRKVNVNLAGSVTCPKCEHEFLPDSETSVEDLNESKKNLSKDREEASVNIEETTLIISELKEETVSLRKKLDAVKLNQKEEDAKVQVLREELTIAEENLSNKQREIKRLQFGIETLNSTLESNKQLKLDYLNKIELFNELQTENTAIKEIKKKILTCDKDIEEINSKIKDKQDERFQVAQWIFNFKKFRSKLAQESLLVIQNKVNEQLKEMKSELRLKLSGFKQLADGSLKEKITPNIINNGDEVAFGSLSGGERVRVDFATILSLQDIINQTHPYGGLDLLWTDEIGEGIDPLGLSLLMRSMPSNRTVMVTTHVTIKDLHDGVLTVENNNGISSIVW